MDFDEPQIYQRADCVVFKKTQDAFGGLSNMAAGFPLKVNGVSIRTSEALYQACRFPKLPDVQKLIVAECSPMAAKMRSKPYRQDSREDWDEVRVPIMTWCLHVKLAQHWRKFGELLRETGDKTIVEESGRDPFWGAKAKADGTLVGHNALGRLLMLLREDLGKPSEEALKHVAPLDIPDFIFYGEHIQVVSDC